MRLGLRPVILRVYSKKTKIKQLIYSSIQTCLLFFYSYKFVLLTTMVLSVQQHQSRQQQQR